MKVPGYRSNQSCSCQPMPEPQQHQIRAASATYTTAHDNAGSLTYRVRPVIEPATSWFLVGFVSTAQQWELHISYYKYRSPFGGKKVVGCCAYIRSSVKHKLHLYLAWSPRALACAVSGHMVTSGGITGQSTEREGMPEARVQERSQLGPFHSPSDSKSWGAGMRELSCP